MKGTTAKRGQAPKKKFQYVLKASFVQQALPILVLVSLLMTVLPGFIQTKMTESLDLPEKLVSLPEEVAEDIYAAFKKSKDVIYTKWFWRWIMMFIRAIPEPIFKRLNL